LVNRALRAYAPAARFARTSSAPKRRMFWYVRAMPARAMRCGGSELMRAPSSEIFPAASGASPVVALTSVVFPAPFGPMSPSTCDGSTASETSFSASTPP
jgi:hypothetical protein